MFVCVFLFGVRLMEHRLNMQLEENRYEELTWPAGGRPWPARQSTENSKVQIQFKFRPLTIQMVC